MSDAVVPCCSSILPTCSIALARVSLQADEDDQSPTPGVFFRSRFPDTATQQCHRFASSIRPSAQIRPAVCQGYCSYTLFLDEDCVMQFRPSRFRLQVALHQSARDVYGRLAPDAKFLGIIDTSNPMDTGSGCSGLAAVPRPDDAPSVLHVYSFSRVPGIRLADFRANTLGTGDLETTRVEERASLVRCFARIASLSWNHSEDADSCSAKRGRVGSTMRWRINTMLENLPSRFFPVVESISSSLDQIESLPWVFTHGDLTPSNILVCQEGTAITGLIDWAEAEMLPFGVFLYGLEELLGESAPGRGFRYFPESNSLRELFWSELSREIPRLRDKKLVSIVKKAGVLGILLWHGIAFDEGLLNRVVDPLVDPDEIQKLDLFLLSRHDQASTRAEHQAAHGSIHRSLFQSVLSFLESLVKVF